MSLTCRIRRLANKFAPTIAARSFRLAAIKVGANLLARHRTGVLRNIVSRTGSLPVFASALDLLLLLILGAPLHRAGRAQVLNRGARALWLLASGGTPKAPEPRQRICTQNHDMQTSLSAISPTQTTPKTHPPQHDTDQYGKLPPLLSGVTYARRAEPGPD